IRPSPPWAGGSPAHTPRLARVSPPVQPEIETQDRVESPARDNPL
ncbi:cardiolipin synthase B, partial [Klebsiella pneumoniae]